MHCITQFFCYHSVKNLLPFCKLIRPILYAELFGKLLKIFTPHFECLKLSFAKSFENPLFCMG